TAPRPTAITSVALRRFMSAILRAHGDGLPPPVPSPRPAQDTRLPGTGRTARTMRRCNEREASGVSANLEDRRPRTLPVRLGACELVAQQRRDLGGWARGQLITMRHDGFAFLQELLALGPRGPFPVPGQLAGPLRQREQLVEG